MCYKCKQRAAFREAFVKMFQLETQREGAVDGASLMILNSIGTIYAMLANTARHQGPLNDFQKLVHHVTDELFEAAKRDIDKRVGDASPDGDTPHPTVQ